MIEIEVGKRNDSTHPTPVSTGHAFFWPWQSSEANSVPVRGSLFPRGSGGAKEKARGAAAEGAPEEGAPIDAKPTTDRCCCFHQGFSCCCSWSLSEKKLLERPIPCLTVNIGIPKGGTRGEKQTRVGRGESEQRLDSMRSGFVESGTSREAFLAHSHSSSGSASFLPLELEGSLSERRGTPPSSLELPNGRLGFLAGPRWPRSGRRGGRWRRRDDR